MSETPAVDTTKLADEISQKIQAAKAPKWKTVLWWTLGIAAVISIITIIIVIIAKKTNPSEAVDYIMQFTQDQVRQAEAAKKIEVAKAEGVSETKIAEIKAAMEIQDEYLRAKRLVEI